MFSYSSAFELDELNGDDVVVDFAYLAEETFLLVVLLTTKGDVQIFHEMGQDKPRRRVLNIPTLWGRPLDPVAVCIGPEASFLAFGLSEGDILVVPMKLLLDVAWGNCGYFFETSAFLVPISSSADLCLRTPTSIVSFVSSHSRSPVLLCANKGGQVLIVDLQTRKLAIEVQAPETIHKIDVFVSVTGVNLLVTGFTMVQWIVPLETGEQGLRETLQVLIPSDLKTLQPPSSLVLRCGDGVVRLCNEDRRGELFASVSMLSSDSSTSSAPSSYTFSIPVDAWHVVATTKTLFALSSSNRIFFNVRFGVSSVDGSRCGEWEEVLTDVCSEWRCLGLVPRRERSSLMPDCFVVNERGLLRLFPCPTSNGDAWIEEFLLFSDFPAPSQLRDAAESISPGAAKELVDRVLLSLLDRFSRNKPPITTSLLAKFVTIAKAQDMTFEGLVGMMEKFKLDHLLLPQILLRIEANPRETTRLRVISLVVRSVQTGSKTALDADCLLSGFLCRHSDLVDGMQQVLDAFLLRSAAILLPRDPGHSRVAVSWLLSTGPEQWNKVDATTRSLMLSVVWGVNWLGVGEKEASSLLALLAQWQTDLRGDSHAHSRSSRIALDNMQRCPSSARVLLIVCTVLGTSTSYTYIPSPSRLIASGLNCSLAFGIDRKLHFWGELSSVQSKNVDTDVIREGSPKASPVHRAKKLILPPAPVTLQSLEVHSMSAGAEHVLLLSSHGSLFSWGLNRYGQCGLGHVNNVPEPAEVSGKWDGTLSLSAGQLHSAVLMDDGRSLWTWGWGMYGQLGHSTTRDRSADCLVPTRVHHLPEPMKEVTCGRVHTALLSRTGVVWVVGGGAYGQLGGNEDTMKQFRWIKVDLGVGVPPVKLLHTRFYMTVAVTEDDRIFEWGRNPQELKMKMFVMRRLRNAKDPAKEADKAPKAPLPMTVPKDFLGVTEVPSTSIEGRIIAVSTGLSHAALISDTGRLLTWGKSLDFQLGHGNKTEKGEPSAVAEPDGVRWTGVEAGSNHTIASTADGRLWSWGRNDMGQCGVPPLRGLSPRKYFFQAKEGTRRCVQLADDSVFVCGPTLVPALAVHPPRGNGNGTEEEALAALSSLDATEAATVCSLFRGLKAPSMAVVHLLAGDVGSAVECLSPETPPALVSLLWDIVANHEELHTRSVLGKALASLPATPAALASRQLRALWPAVWDEPGTQNGLRSEDALKMVATWSPPATEPTHVGSWEGGGAGRVFPRCLHVVDGATAAVSCPTCLLEWRSLLMDTFNPT